MIVTSIEAISKTRSKVYIDYEFAFVLQNRECAIYSICEGNQVPEAVYREIMEELLLPKAKKKAMDLLIKMDRTESELLSKLQQSGFPLELSEEALSYVKNYGYVNDYRYACNYIRSKKHMKSIKMILLELSQKGIDKELANQALEECCIDEDGSIEVEAVKKEVRKRCKRVSDLNYEEKMKITVAIYRKGYGSEVISKVFDELEEMEEQEESCCSY